MLECGLSGRRASGAGPIRDEAAAPGVLRRKTPRFVWQSRMPFTLRLPVTNFVERDFRQSLLIGVAPQKDD